MRLVTRPHHDGFCSITIGSEHVLDGVAAMTEIIAAQLASCGDGRRLRADTRTPGQVLATALADRKELQAAIDQARCAARSLPTNSPPIRCPLSRGSSVVWATTKPEEAVMSVMVIEFLTLDGVMRDPDGAEGTEQGGWMFRFGPGPVEGDKFRLGPLFDTATLLLGRRTWEHFAGFWPTRSDDFSNKMNAMRKLVVSRSLANADSWNNSSLLAGDLVDEVTRRKATEDIVVTGSASVVRTLMAHGLIDEYRLIVFPVLLGQGTRLFDEAPPATFDLVSVESAGPAVRLVYRRPVASDAAGKEKA